MALIFEKLWTLLKQPDPTLWSGVIGIVGAIASGWISGVISGRRAVAAALRGAQQAHEHNVELARISEVGRAVAYVQAIKAELESMYALAEKQILPAVREIGRGKPLQAMFVIGDDYFVVYKASAQALGSVGRRETRDAIVAAYTAAQSFIDTIRVNNGLVEKVERSIVHPSPMDEAVARQVLQTFSGGVYAAAQELTARRAAFLQEVDTWLTTVGAAAG